MERTHLKKVFPLILVGVLMLAIPVAVSLSAGKEAPFEAWLEALRREALSKGISQATLDQALRDLAPISRVVELDRSQPEFTMTLEEYLRRVVSDSRVIKGRAKLQEHRTLLEKVFRRYGVEPRFLIALWGIESDFGRLKGTFPVIGATATLAYDGRRGEFFRKELLHALRIVDQGHISPDRMTGSWAGAMGHFQFMPSSFGNFAVDYEEDGRIDIWNNLGDAFASAANYLAQAGWEKGQIWGLEVELPTGFDRALIDLKVRKALDDWKALGVRNGIGGDLPEMPALLASAVQPDGPGGRAFLVFDNYRAILSWNRSHLFGIAVGTLADRIEAPSTPPRPGS